MRRRASHAIDTLTALLCSWDEVSAVAVNSQGDDLYDPYFSISFDVYTIGAVRKTEERARAFGDVGAFESSSLTHKDRFLLGDIPIRIEYKLCARFDEVVQAARRGVFELRDTGTYALWRLGAAEITFSRDGWVERVRESLEQLPDEFWSRLRAIQEARAEHLYSDLMAATVRGDTFYFVATAGPFLVAICSLLFTINHKLEPAPRMLRTAVLELERLPSSFQANVEHFVAQETALTMTQRGELAELMVRGVLSL